ncbi:MAG: hypothetical protein AB1540_01550 [Bdellovibrionota bacterium]
MKQIRRKSAISAINTHGMLLVFPIDNARLPLSLWSVAYPEHKMLWQWDDEGDDRVSRMWHLREELSRSREVIYTKWYRGRATFFSKSIFTAMLASFLGGKEPLRGLSHEAREILEILETDSPLSTKALKRSSGLQGRTQEATYQRTLKELWSRLLIVGFGEVDEGAFPSLAIGSTRVLFEDLFQQAQKMSPKESQERLKEFFKTNALAEKFFLRTQNSFQPREAVRKRIHPSGYIEFNG